jgi:hypothetical protein
MIPFSLFEQVSRFDLDDIIELKKHSNYMRAFQEIVSPERIAYTTNGIINIDELDYSSLIDKANYAIYQLTGIYTKNRTPEISIYLDPEIDGIEHNKNGDEIEIVVDSKSRIPDVGVLIDKLIIKDIERGFHTYFSPYHYKLSKDDQREIENTVKTILVQNGISHIKDPNHKDPNHKDLIQEFISRFPIFMKILEMFPEESLQKHWLTPRQKSDLTAISKVKNMIF